MTHRMRVAIAAMLFTAGVASCSNPTVPRDCIDAAEELGAPQFVLDWLNNPTDDLSQGEKVLIRQALNRTALNDLCGSTLNLLNA